ADAGGDHRRVAGPRPGGDQRLRKPRVAVRDARLAPRPVGLIGAAEETEEPLADRAAGGLHASVAFECAEILLDTEESEGPGARTAEARHRGERRMKQLARKGEPSRIGGTSDDGAEGPQRTAVAIL